jgi:hypothetical protein
MFVDLDLVVSRPLPATSIEELKQHQAHTMVPNPDIHQAIIQVSSYFPASSSSPYCHAAPSHDPRLHGKPDQGFQLTLPKLKEEASRSHKPKLNPFP